MLFGYFPFGATTQPNKYALAYKLENGQYLYPKEYENGGRTFPKLPEARNMSTSSNVPF